jgi:hypothetical protein
MTVRNICSCCVATYPGMFFAPKYFGAWPAYHLEDCDLAPIQCVQRIGSIRLRGCRTTTLLSQESQHAMKYALGKPM